MNKKKKNTKAKKEDFQNILLYFLSFVPFAISCIFFGYAFYYESQKHYYFFTLLFLVLFCVFNYFCNKKITCVDGYNLMQAFFFYHKCKKLGVSQKSHKLDNEQIALIREVAQKYDYSSGFDDKKIIILYQTGYKTSSYFKKIKEKVIN